MYEWEGPHVSGRGHMCECEGPHVSGRGHMCEWEGPHVSGRGHRYEWEGPHDHTISHDTLRVNPMCCSRPQTKQQKHKQHINHQPHYFYSGTVGQTVDLTD